MAELSILPNYPLLSHNTFGLPAVATHFTIAYTVADVQAAVRSGIYPIRVLGGGSNILLTRDVSGLLLKNSLKGIQILSSDDRYTYVEVMGGENWHTTVLWAVEQQLGGLENLSLIPGTVGAAPVQNIGAYGVELKDILVHLQAVDLNSGELHQFSNEACQFGYRNSIFKHQAKDQYCIVSVVMRLTHTAHHIQIAYGDIQKTLEAMQVTGEPTIGEVSQAVIHIRSSKLPDPAQIGNCGSFFKNPEVDAAIAQKVLDNYPTAPNYPLKDGRVKIPAGWLIEQCGWKGKRVGNTGSYSKQALVLVNYGGATGVEVLQLVQNIIESVADKFGIVLEPEVNIW
jgi:UDP-N-acetylmuramate dehydrogenase